MGPQNELPGNLVIRNGLQLILGNSRNFRIDPERWCNRPAEPDDQIAVCTVGERYARQQRIAKTDHRLERVGFHSVEQLRLIDQRKPGGLKLFELGIIAFTSAG